MLRCAGLLAALLALPMSAHAAGSSAHYAIPASTVDAGGQRGSSAHYSTEGHLASPAGIGSSAAFGIDSGFFAQTIPPETTITNGPSGTVNSTSATFSFSADEAATFSYKLDGGVQVANVTGSVDLFAIAQGSHTFSVFAIDAAGNADVTPATRTWTVDTMVPETTITSGPSGTVNSSGATITFSGTDNGTAPGSLTFEGALDGAAFAAVTSPVTLSGLSDGAHTYQVRARDAAGNVDPTPASVTWTVDTIAPVVTPPGNVTMHATSPAGAVVNYGAATATDAVTASPAITYSKASNTLFAPGTTTVTVTATDAAGNAGTATFTVTVTPLTPAENWRYANFGTAANTGAAAGTADADGDGKTNAVELAFGTDPNNAGSGPGALTFTGTFAGGGAIGQRGQPIVRAEGTDRRALFMRRIDYAAAGLTYAVEFTGDLSTWEASTATPVAQASDGVYEIVSVPYPSFVSGQQARYFRVRVTLAP